MTDDRDDPLLRAVEALTKPIVENTPQKADDGTYIRTHTSSQPALLEQLRLAVNPSSNSAGGSASLKYTRNLIDGDALRRYSTMTAAIGDWCYMMKVERTREPITNLQRWYTAYRFSGQDGTWYIRELDKWAEVIKKLVDPPNRIEITAACPVCKSITWVDPDGQTMPWPILIEYPKPVDEEPIKPYAICRAPECGATWNSFESIIELADEMNDTPESEARTTTV